MPWEYMTVESTDFGHPGGSPRYQELIQQLGELSKEGWEVDQLIPTMQRGRADAQSGKESSTLTAVAILALLKRKVE